MAGLWDQVRRVVTDLSAGRNPAAPSRSKMGTPVYGGPDACELVTADEIEAATGNRPVGPGDRKSGGSQTDIGLFKVCEWMLTGGDELLTNITICRDQAAVDLAKSRNWNEEDPLPGVGDLGSFKVNRDPRGNNELHMTAFQGRYIVSFVHTSAAHATDITPLKDLMLKVLARLD